MMITNMPKSQISMIEPLLSIQDIASILQISRRGVERMRCSGRFPRQDLTLGRLPRWKPTSVNNWIDSGGVVLDI